MMITKRLLVTLGSAAAILAFGLGCSTDSPTAPVQDPGPPPGTSPPSARWNIQVTVSPAELEINSPQPATVAVRVTRADNGQAPASGTTIVVSTSLGDFDSAGSGVGSTALTTVDGRASVLLFAGPVAGTALISAQLESSVGQRTIKFMEQVEAIEAAFSFQNSEGNLSVQFLDQSIGNPTEWLWDFGDGKTTSTEQNPSHIFRAAGDYAVTLTASKEGSSDTTSQIVTVGQPLDLFINFISPSGGSAGGGTLVTINGSGFANPLLVLFGNKFGDVQSVSSTQITVLTPPGDMIVEVCQLQFGAGEGTRTLDTPVSVTIELQSGPTATLPSAFTYLSDSDECVPN